MTNRIKSLALVLSGVVIGCGAAATVGASWAGPTPGQWSCYKPDGFPDIVVDEEASYGMNRVATRAPAGTVVTYQKGAYPHLCVRD